MVGSIVASLLWSGALFSKQIYISELRGLGWLEMGLGFGRFVFSKYRTLVLGIGFWCWAYCIWIFHPP